MANEDKELYHFFESGLQDLVFTQEKRKTLQHVVKQQMVQSQDKGWKLIFNWIRNFMNTTYEVSLLHVGAGIAVIALIANIALFSLSSPSLGMERESAQIMRYVQQTTVSQDGSIRIVFVPIYEEDR